MSITKIIILFFLATINVGRIIIFLDKNRWLGLVYIIIIIGGLIIRFFYIVSLLHNQFKTKTSFMMIFLLLILRAFIIANNESFVIIFNIVKFNNFHLNFLWIKFYPFYLMFVRFILFFMLLILYFVDTKLKKFSGRLKEV